MVSIRLVLCQLNQNMAGLIETGGRYCYLPPEIDCVSQAGFPSKRSAVLRIAYSYFFLGLNARDMIKPITSKPAAMKSA